MPESNRLPNATRFVALRALFDTLAGRAVGEREGRLRSVRETDPELAADVAALLDANDADDTFLESPFVYAALSRSGAREPPGPAECEDRSGQLVAHYRLTQKLGQGGMGVVYRAWDIALGREAAVKVLAGRSTKDLQDRLNAEAIACARLQHPAIATFYESGEADGRAFIAMEYVPGETLRERLARGPMPHPTSLGLATHLLEALSHAHAVGVLHCDIKPENIMLTPNGTAKLLDFGIARLRLDTLDTRDDAGEYWTGASLAGTVGYMSPEQIRNDPLDARSDVFQMAAVLYEMVAGRPAFPGRTAAERLAAVLSTEPPPISPISPIEAPGTQGAFDAALSRALTKDATRRTPSAAAFLSALRDTSDGPISREGTDSVAVLEFRSLGEAGDDWIGGGLRDLLVDDIRRHPTLQLVDHDRIARMTRLAMARPADESEIEQVAMDLGLALGCRWIVAGSYGRMGSTLRVVVSLIEVATRTAVMRQEQAGTNQQLFDLQRELADALCARLVPSTTPESSSYRRPALSAYECYARARQLVMSNDRGLFEQARTLFETAIDRDPHFARAHAGLARIQALNYTFTNDRRVLQSAVNTANRAIAIDPQLAEAYVWLGYACWRLGRTDEADHALAQARQLAPDDGYAYYFGAATVWPGQPDAALSLMRRAVTLDPARGTAWWGLGSTYTALGLHDEAVSCFARCVRLRELPDAIPVPGVEGYWGECLRRMGRFEEARAQCLQALDAVEASDHFYRDSLRVFALLTLGRVAADQHDGLAARAALQQVSAHLHGRPRTLAGGTLSVRALAVLACLDRDDELYRRAVDRFVRRDALDFHWMFLCDDYQTWALLGDTADVLGHADDALAFRARAAVEGPP
jgi:serine/threonine protein kinase/tetratricopeptide (TPR) repeat protein